MRMISMHDEVHKLGNEIRDRNSVIFDIDDKINWNQNKIDEELKFKHSLENETAKRSGKQRWDWENQTVDSTDLAIDY